MIVLAADHEGLLPAPGRLAVGADGLSVAVFSGNLACPGNALDEVGVTVVVDGGQMIALRG